MRAGFAGTDGANDGLVLLGLSESTFLVDQRLDLQPYLPAGSKHFGGDVVGQAAVGPQSAEVPRGAADNAIGDGTLPVRRNRDKRGRVEVIERLHPDRSRETTIERCVTCVQLLHRPDRRAAEHQDEGAVVAMHIVDRIEL